MDINKFIAGIDSEPQEPEKSQWYQIIRPTTVNIILGKKGTGKSALGYFLLENAGKHYDLLPVVVNLPPGKQTLLPESFGIRGLEGVKRVEDSIVLIDEGTTMLPAGQARLEEMVKGFQALSRQRNQIIILIFHASSDVGSRILRGVDAVLLKEPSKRQIQHGSKDSWWHDLLLEAKGKFKTVADMGEDTRKYTYVDSEEPEFRGLLVNPLCSFWSEELSCAWAGTDIEKKVRLFDMGRTSPTPERRRWVTAPEEIEPRPQEFSIEPIYERDILIGFTILDPEGDVIRSRAKITELLHEKYPGVSIRELENSSISYFDYRVEVELSRE